MLAVVANHTFLLLLPIYFRLFPRAFSGRAVTSASSMLADTGISHHFLRLPLAVVSDPLGSLPTPQPVAQMGGVVSEVRISEILRSSPDRIAMTLDQQVKLRRTNDYVATCVTRTSPIMKHDLRFWGFGGIRG